MRYMKLLESLVATIGFGGLVSLVLSFDKPINYLWMAMSIATIVIACYVGRRLSLAKKAIAKFRFDEPEQQL